jgi:hypothetical protein
MSLPDRTVEESISDTAGVAADVPAPAAGTAVAMPDFYYVPLVERQNQAVVAAKDEIFSRGWEVDGRLLRHARNSANQPVELALCHN